MMPVNGGIVQDVTPYPSRLRAGRVFAVLGVWSGGMWSHHDQITVQQYRNAQVIAVWQMVGVDIPARRHTDAIVLLRDLSESARVEPGDILIFGEGRYSQLELADIGTQINAPKAIKIGPAQYNAIALSNTRILVFHEPEATLPDSPTQVVWIDNQPCTATLSQRLSEGRDYSVEVYLNHQDVTLKRLLTTLDPLRGFVLDAGQELLTTAPRSRGASHVQAAINTFEPTVSALPGSLRLILHPAQPQQIPLYVKPSDPLKLMIDVVRAASQKDAQYVAEVLSEQFLAAEILIARLMKLSDTAERYGDIYLRPSDNTSSILVSKTVTETLRAGLEIIEERTEVRTGIVIDMVLSRHWLRLQSSHNDRAEEWTLTFTKDLDSEMYNQKLPRRAHVVFSTRTPEKLTSGKGYIKEFTNLPDESDDT